MYNYSQFLTTIYDERLPVGHLGHGTHYSVLRSATWIDDCRLPLKEPKAHDFAIIWDKDHNDRVIDVVEHLYMKNLLAPVLFVGESKGSLCVLVSHRFKETSDGHDFQAYVTSVSELARGQYDPLTAEVCPLGDSLSEIQIIASSQERVNLYLRNIYMLWDLGIKELKAGLIKPDLNAEPLLVNSIR
jgi:hypothetical protein